MDEFFTKLNFPYSSVRDGQDEFIRRVDKAISQNKNIMVSAPTGSGKTVSALAPAIYHAKAKGLTVVCLTSRQTQANQVIKTIHDINRKASENKSYKDGINYVAFIGKRSMCVHEDRALYPASDFNEFCKKVRETGKCKFFRNSHDSEREDQIKQVLVETSHMNVEGFVDLAGGCKLCPYELAGKKAASADVVICDYNYLFSTGIKEGFLGKIGRTMEQCIVVVDEAHNLPDRIRNSYSYTLSTEILKNALNELKEFVKSNEYDEFIIGVRQALEELLFDRLDSNNKDHLIEKDEFFSKLLSKFNGLKVEDIADKLFNAGALIKEDKVISFVERVGVFLTRWAEVDTESYLRVLEKDVKEGKTVLNLRIKCIDSSEIAADVLNSTFSSVLMSGTLSPIEMYRDILGVANCDLLELDSPFAKENQLTLVDNEVTTKFTSRSPEMFRQIANNVEKVLNSSEDRNAIVFFPSYDLMDKVLSYVNIVLLGRKVLKEQRYMTKEDKEKFIDEFKDNGLDMKSRVLFAVTSGSFAEGLDLPREALEVVIVVGLPLAVPDVFTQAVIRHFDKKFGKGQQYGYVYPAMSKIIQAAGRCIRTEEDKGIVVLMDSRFLFPTYALSFPKHWHMKVPTDFELEIKEFFR